MEDTLCTRVAAEIRAEMARRKLTQVDLAHLIGKPQTTVSRWVSGLTKLDLEQVEMLARALGVTASELVSWGEATDPTPSLNTARRDVLRLAA
jgi:transcriptional regulator with XRE-family HTH domain